MNKATNEQVFAAAEALGMPSGRFKRKEDLTNNIFVEWCKQVYVHLLHKCQETEIERIQEVLLGV